MRACVLGLCLVFNVAGIAYSQEVVPDSEVGSEAVSDSPPQESAGDAVDDAQDLAETAQDQVEKIADQVDRDERAIKAKESVLAPIYQLAESMSFSAFHWIAFALMVAGVVSYGLQLVLGKLVVLSKMGFSLTEILSDALGFLISLIGLVLTTQAATENSTFSQSAFAVLSATVVGVGVGFVFYLWGQRQELEAVQARRAAAKDGKRKK